jgi:hypothetical protein
MKRILAVVLWVLSFVLLGYAIYRSTAIRQVIPQANGGELVYGEPQHGLILGLCILSGLLIASSIPLLLDRQNEIRVSDREALSRRTV